MDTDSDRQPGARDALIRALDAAAVVRPAEAADLADVVLGSIRAAAATQHPVLALDGIFLVADRLSDPAATPEERLTMRAHVRDLVLEAMKDVDHERDARALISSLELADATASDPTPLPDARARAYLDAVLEADHRQAVTLIRDYIEDGTPIDEVLVDVLEATQREVGRLWQRGRISWVTEHYCTAVTQRALSEVYTRLFVGRTQDLRLLAVHAPGDGHRLGLRMIVDLLEHEGWTTTYVGDPVDAELLPDLLSGSGGDVLAISASMPGQIEVVRKMIDAVRRDHRTRGVPVVVGGRPFALDPALATAVRADGTAADVRSASALCRRLAEAVQ